MNEINQQQVTHEEELKELKESLRHRFEQHSDKLGKNMEDFMTQEKVMKKRYPMLIVYVYFVKNDIFFSNMEQLLSIDFNIVWYIGF